MQYELAGTVHKADDEGYVLDIHAWNTDLAEVIANNEGIEMSADAWEVVLFLREYYEEYQIAPAMRVLTKAIKRKLGDDKGNSVFLYGLFPNGPAKQACKIAGLPKPTNCI